ncbi:hypothetical protein C0989_007640 [Termitomyces sp. Mn162]|nr:hypothetical protein C0989_007640 [Termitomyces sp. Mn162]
MHFLSLFLAACVTLHVLAAPLPVPAGETRNLELTNTISPLRSDHLSPSHHITVSDLDELWAPEHEGKSHCGSPIVDHSKTIVPRNPTHAKPTTEEKNPAKKTPSINKNPSTKKKPPIQKTSLSQPDVEEIKQHIHIGPDESLFYSGPNGYMRLADAQAKKMSKKILDMAWTDRDLLKTKRKKTFWKNASQAFAELSSGMVYVLLPEDVGINNFHKGTIWEEVEWPTLEKNVHVTKVIKVTEGGKEEVLLDRTGSSH